VSNPKVIPPAPREPATILVVDDSEPGRYVTSHILMREGYRVIEAATGAEALELAATLPAVVVLDVHLPDFSGFEVCRRLRANPRTANIPVLHLSSTFLDEGSVITGLEGGADGYLTLPVEPPVLLAYVRAMLRVGQAMRTLQESEQRFRSLFEGISDGLLLADPEVERFRMANPTVCEMLGYTREELEGMWFTDIHPPSNRADQQAQFSRMLTGEITMAPNEPTLRKDGSTVHMDIGSTMLNIDGRAMLLGSFRDVTQRRAMEQRLAQADRLASVGLLASGVAHEINNPLAFVLYNLQAVVEELRQARADGRPLHGMGLEEALGKLEACEEGAQRVRGIVKDLQTFSRVEQRALARLRVQDMVKAVVAMASHEIRFRARLVLELEPTLPVSGDEGRISQVILNLLLNAAQAIDEGQADSNVIQLRTSGDGDEVRIEVHDTGRGIPAEDIPRLFDPFFTTKQVGEGTGLGLAICHRIVQEHAGRIEVSSVVGEGSRFTIVLPAVAEAVTASPEPAPAPARADRPARLLLIDDEPHLLRAVMRLLTRAGFTVATASSGREAQDILREDTGFDAILCDLMMPDLLGMDLHAWLADRDPDLAQRLIFLTGGTFTPHAQDYLSRVGNRVLTKPLPRNELLGAIRTVIEEQGRSRSGRYQPA
jgi:PAS domain S-box-containing protein